MLLTAGRQAKVKLSGLEAGQEELSYPCSSSSSWTHFRSLRSTHTQSCLACWHRFHFRRGREKSCTHQCLFHRVEKKWKKSMRGAAMRARWDRCGRPREDAGHLRRWRSQRPAVWSYARSGEQLQAHGALAHSFPQLPKLSRPTGRRCICL